MTIHIRVVAVASELTISDMKAKCSNLMAGSEYEMYVISPKKTSKHMDNAANDRPESLIRLVVLLPSYYDYTFPSHRRRIANRQRRLRRTQNVKPAAVSTLYLTTVVVVEW